MTRVPHVGDRVVWIPKIANGVITVAGHVVEFHASSILSDPGSGRQWIVTTAPGNLRWSDETGTWLLGESPRAAAREGETIIVPPPAAMIAKRS